MPEAKGEVSRGRRRTGQGAASIAMYVLDRSTYVVGHSSSRPCKALRTHSRAAAAGAKERTWPCSRVQIMAGPKTAVLAVAVAAAMLAAREASAQQPLVVSGSTTPPGFHRQEAKGEDSRDNSPWLIP